MALSNHERVGKALDILKAGLPAFVERELKSAHGTKWLATARTVVGSSIQIGGTEQAPDWDAAGLLGVLERRVCQDAGARGTQHRERVDGNPEQVGASEAVQHG